MEMVKPNNMLESFNQVPEIPSHLASTLMCAGNIIRTSFQVGEFPPHSRGHRKIINRMASPDLGNVCASNATS